MGKILTTSASTPVVVDTQYGALSTNFYVVPVSDQLLDQWYDEQKREYKPDRTTSPLVLQAILSISDPDGVLPSQTSTFASILWEEIVEYKDNGGNTVVVNNGDVTEIEDTVIIGQTAVRVYTVQTDGKLVCRRNVEPSKSYRLKCTATYNDTRNGNTLTFESSVLLTTSRTAIENYILQLDTPRIHTFRPLIGDGTVSNVTFGATFQRPSTSGTGLTQAIPTECSSVTQTLPVRHTSAGRARSCSRSTPMQRKDSQSC